MKQPLTASPSARLSGRIRVPGDKSISHRALILGALATGTTRITGLLEAEDVAGHRAGRGGARRRGGTVERRRRGEGPRGRRLARPVRAARLRQFRHRQPPHARRRRRPRHASRIHGRCLLAATAHGPRACARLPPWACKPTPTTDHATLPLVVRGTRDLLPIVYDLPVPSAQVKSAVLLAGLHAPGRTTVVEPLAARDHTERMLGFFGAEIVTEDRGDGRPRRHRLRRRRASRREHRRAGRSELRRLHDRRGADLARLRHRGRGRAPQPDAKRLHRDLARDGREYRDARPPRRRRRAGRRPPRAERARSRAFACRPSVRRR